jgi:hypothetical protein
MTLCSLVSLVRSLDYGDGEPGVLAFPGITVEPGFEAAVLESRDRYRLCSVATCVRKVIISPLSGKGW